VRTGRGMFIEAARADGEGREEGEGGKAKRDGTYGDGGVAQNELLKDWKTAA